MGEIDSFDFALAEHLHKHLHEIRELPNSEIVEWQAFFNVRAVQQEHQSKGGT